MPLLIIVRAARGDRRVALSEAHPDHPGGQAWITGDGREHVVALTREAARRIGDGSLDLVGPAHAPDSPPSEAAPSEAAPSEAAPAGPWQRFGATGEGEAPPARRKR